MINWMEEAVFKNPVSCVDFLISSGAGRSPKHEEVILTHLRATVLYARDILKERWPAGEKILLEGCLNEGQFDKEIALNAAFEYAWKVMGERWPELETLLLRHRPYEGGALSLCMCPGIRALYVAHVVKEPWPDMEQAIIGSPEDCLIYADLVIGGKWEKGEEAILLNPSTAFQYATRVLKERWLEAEPVIHKASFFSNKYRDHFEISYTEMNKVLQNRMAS